MSTDPRVEAVAKARWLYWPEVSVQTTPDMQLQHITEELAAADAVDPLRKALREPSDELIERLSNVYYTAYYEKRMNDDQNESDSMRAVLAALADEFGVKK